MLPKQARRNEIDIGGAVNKANCTGLRENFCSTTPFRLLEATWLYKLPFLIDELLFTELRQFLK